MTAVDLHDVTNRTTKKPELYQLLGAVNRKAELRRVDEIGM
jgi:hypothetical protein